MISSLILQYAFTVCFLYKITAADEAFTHDTNPEGEMMNFSRGLNYTQNENVRVILTESTPIQDQPFLMHHFSPKMKFSRIKRSKESRAKQKKFQKKKKSEKRKFGTKKRKQNKENVTYMKYKVPNVSKHKSNKKFKKYIYKKKNQKSRKSPRKKSHVKNENTYLDSADFNDIFEMIKRKLPKIDKFWIKIKENSDEEKDIPKNLNSLGYNSTELYGEESNSLIRNTHAINNNSNIHFSKNVTNHDEIGNSIINAEQSKIPFKNFGESNISSIRSERKKNYHENAVEKEKINELTTLKSRGKFPIINLEKGSTDIRNVKEVMDISSKNLQTANNVSKKKNQTKLQPLEISESPINQILRNFDKIALWKNSIQNRSTLNDLNWENSSESIMHTKNENKKHFETEDISIATVHYDSNNINTLDKITPSINSSGDVLLENHEENYSEDHNKIPNAESITKYAIEPNNTFFEFSKAWQHRNPKTEKNLNKSSKTNMLDRVVFEMTPGTLSSSDESDSFVRIHAFSENANHADLEDVLPEISRKLHSDIPKKDIDKEHSYKLSVKPDNSTINRIKNDTIYKEGRDSSEETSAANVIPSIRFDNYESPNKHNIASDSINNEHFKTDLKKDSKLEEEENSLKYRMNDEIGVITTNPNRVANQTKILRYIFKGHLLSPNEATELRKNNSNEGDSMPQRSKTHIFSDKYNSSLFMPINFEDGQIQETSIDSNLNTPPASKTHLKKSYEFEEVSSSTNIIKDNNASRTDVLNDPSNLLVFSHNTGSFNTVAINDTYFQNDYQIFSATDRDEISNSDAKSIDETVKKRNNLENKAISVLPDPLFNELRDSKSLILQMPTTGNNFVANYAESSDTLSNEFNYENSISGGNISNIFHPYNRSMYISAKRFNELHEIREADMLANKMSQEEENTNNKAISLKYPAISTGMHKYTPNHIQKNLGDTYFADGLSTLPNSSKHEFNTERDEIYTEPANFTTNTSTETPNEIYEFKEVVISKNKSAEEKKKVQNITIYESTFTSLNVSPESDSSFIKEVPNSRYDKNSKDYSSEIITNLQRNISLDDHFNKQIQTTHVVQRSNTTTLPIEPIGDSYEAKKVEGLKNKTIIEENFKNEVSSVNSFTETKLISDNGAPSNHTSTSAKAKNISRDTMSQFQELHTIRSYPYQVNRTEETYKKEYTNKTLDALMEETLPALKELYKNDFLAVQKMHLPKNTTYRRIIGSYLPDNQEILLANISDNATGLTGSNTTIAVFHSSTEETFKIFTDNVFEKRDEIVISNSAKLENNSEFEEGSRINNSATEKVKGLDFLTTQDILSSHYNLKAKNHTPEYLFRSHEQLNNTSNFITDTVSEVEQITNKPFDVFYEIREIIISPTKHIKIETNTENDFTTATHFTKSDSLIYPTKHSKKETGTGNKFTTATHAKQLDSLNHSDVLNLQKISNFDKINNSDFGSRGLLKQMHSKNITNDKIRKIDNTNDLIINNNNTKQFLKSQTAEMYTMTRTFNFENQENAFTPKDIYGDNPISKTSFSLHNNKMKNSPVSITPELTNLFDRNSSYINLFDSILKQSNGMKNGVTVQQISEDPVSTHEDIYNKNPLTVSKINLSTNNAEFQGVSEENFKEIQNNLPYQVFATELGNTTIMINSETKQNFEQPIRRVFVVKEIVVNSYNIFDPENEIGLSSKNSTIHYDRPFIKALPITDTNKNSLDAFNKHDMETSTDKAEIYYKMRKNIFSPNTITKQENNYEKVNIFNNNVNQSDSLIKSETHITNVDEKEDKTSTESLYLQPVISRSMAVMRKNNLMTQGILQTGLSTPEIFNDFGFPSHNNVTNFNKNENSGDKINNVINEASLKKATISPDIDGTSSNSTSLKSVNATNVPSNKTMVEENTMQNHSQSTFSITESYQLYDGNSAFLKGTSTKDNNFPESSTSLSNEILNDGMTSESLDNNTSNTTVIFFSETLSSNMSEGNVIALNDSVKLENKTENEHLSTIPVTVYENTFSLRTMDFNDIISFPVTVNTINQTPSTNTSFSFSDNIKRNEDFKKENKDVYKNDEDSTENTERENIATKFVFFENKTFNYLFNNFNEATLDSEDMLLHMLNNNASNNESKELPMKGIFPADFLQKEIIDAQKTESNVSDITRVITEIPSATYDREEAFDLQKNIVFKNSKKNSTFTNVHNDNSTIYTTRIFTKELLDVNQTRNNSLNTSSPLFLRTNVGDKNRSISDATTPIRFIFIINNKVTDGSENIKNRGYSLNAGNEILERKISSITLPNKRMENDDTYSYTFEQNKIMVSSPKLKENPKFSFFEQKNTVTEHEIKPDFRKRYVENDYFIKSNKKMDNVKYDAGFMITDNFYVKNNQANDYFRKDGDNDIENQAFRPSSIGINQLYFKTGDGDRYFYTKPHIETQNSELKQSSKGINTEFMPKNNNDKVKIRKDIFVVPRCFSKASRLGNYKVNEDGDEIDDIRKKHANQINIRITEFKDKDSQLSSPSNPLENEIDFRENQFVNKKKNAYMSSESGAKIENTAKTKIKPFLFRQYPIFQRNLDEPHVKSVNNRMSSSVNTPENNPVILTLFADQMNSEHKNPLNSNNKEAVNTKFYKFLQNSEGGSYNPSGERYGKDWLWTNVEHKDGINIHISPAISKLSSISIETQNLNSIPENYEMTDMYKLRTNIDSDNFFPEKQRKFNQWINYNKFSQRNKRDLKQFNTFKNNPLFSSIRDRNRKSNVDENVSEKINICSECLDVDEKSERKTNFPGSKFLLQDELHETERNDGEETISETIKKDFSESEINDNSKLQNIIEKKNYHFGPPKQQMRNQYNNAENSISHKLAGRFISFLNDKTASGTPMLASYLKDNHWTDAFRSKTLVNKNNTENIKRLITDEVKDSQSDFTNPSQSIVSKKQMSPADNTGFDLSDDENPDTIKYKEKEYDLELSDNENANSMKNKQKEHDLELLDYENSDAMKDEEKEHDLELSDDKNANIMRDNEKKQLFWELFLPFFQSMNMTKDRKYMHQADKYT